MPLLRRESEQSNRLNRIHLMPQSSNRVGEAEIQNNELEARCFAKSAQGCRNEAPEVTWATRCLGSSPNVAWHAVAKPRARLGD